jgi:hypothetical protein
MMMHILTHMCLPNWMLNFISKLLNFFSYHPCMYAWNLTQKISFCVVHMCVLDSLWTILCALPSSERNLIANNNINLEDMQGFHGNGNLKGVKNSRNDYINEKVAMLVFA